MNSGSASSGTAVESLLVMKHRSQQILRRMLNYSKNRRSSVGKLFFALRTSISKEYIDHVRDLRSPKQVWETLQKLCEKLEHLKRDCWVKIVCDRYEKSGHIMANCRAKMQEKEANVVHDSSEFQQPTWEQCLSIEVLDQPTNVTSAVHQDDVSIDVLNCNKEWIVDSGCSHHATGNDTLLSNVHLHRKKKLIMAADNSLYLVTEERDLNDGDVLINNIYINRKESLYVLSSSDEYVKKAGHDASSTLWHAYLSYVGFQLLQKISINQLLDGIHVFKGIHHDEICPDCQYGKFHCLPFSSSKSKASAPLQLVHSDILGPTRTPSYTGLHYVMLIMDNFSRKGWRCMDSETKEFIISYDVVFDEVSCHKDDANGSKGTTSLALFPDDFLLARSFSSIEGCIQSEENTDATTSSETVTSRNPLRQKRLSSHLSDDIVEINHFSVLSCIFIEESCENEPKLYNKAKGVPEWENAMVEEISTLNKNGTWELVPKLFDANLITCKWVYRLKKKVNGTIDRYKARLVAHGFSQQYGQDYDETFSPIARMTTVRAIISLAASKGWKLWQLDVKNTFLYGESDRYIFMEQLQGFVSKEYPDHVCRLKKALYGLKQALHAWFGKIAQHLYFCGFKSSSADPSLFIKKTPIVCTLLLLYVDDMIITGDDSAKINSLQDALIVHFEMRSLDETGSLFWSRN
ncbi:hypothetical protein CXB51_034316 [Gossypium anomalum]|uniref:Reverse transcriptase Ty1/copia-type domain-containing protein n=1 Tax=Gossypium anomalum TaxID=47600 RepID=A0A8J6CF04_9ROSI|nr:hypothetical protein CXB51_034316 [Gossypium anomalum]